MVIHRALLINLGAVHAVNAKFGRALGCFCSIVAILFPFTTFHTAGMLIIRVALMCRSTTLFDYRAEDAMAGDIGRRVLVPFGKKNRDWCHRRDQERFRGPG